MHVTKQTVLRQKQTVLVSFDVIPLSARRHNDTHLADNLFVFKYVLTIRNVRAS